jgi:hypothetical protein
VGAAFIINAASFIGLIWIVARWKRPRRKRTTPPERVIGATIEAIRYVRYSPEIRGLILRSGIVMFFASALLALLPTVAHRVSGSAVTFGLLLRCFGFGAVLGAFVMQSARSRWSTEVVTSGGVVILGATPSQWALCMNCLCSAWSWWLAALLGLSLYPWSARWCKSSRLIGSAHGSRAVPAGFSRRDSRWQRALGRGR